MEQQLTTNEKKEFLFSKFRSISKDIGEKDEFTGKNDVLYKIPEIIIPSGDIDDVDFREYDKKSIDYLCESLGGNTVKLLASSMQLGAKIIKYKMENNQLLNKTDFYSFRYAECPWEWYLEHDLAEMEAVQIAPFLKKEGASKILISLLCYQDANKQSSFKFDVAFCNTSHQRDVENLQMLFITEDGSRISLSPDENHCWHTFSEGFFVDAILVTIPADVVDKIINKNVRVSIRFGTLDIRGMVTPRYECLPSLYELYANEVLTDSEIDTFYEANAVIMIEEDRQADEKEEEEKQKRKEEYKAKRDAEDAKIEKMYEEAHKRQLEQPSSQGCYIATAVYGSYDCPQVWTLRRFRDYTLDETWYGKAFIRLYYAISPSFVRWFGHKTWFSKLFKAPLDKLVSRLKNSGVEDTPYMDKY